MSAYRSAVKKAARDRNRPNWSDLWSRLRVVFTIAGKKRDVAVLDNFKDRKESICRKFNVVCRADVLRISTELKNSK